MTDAVLAQLTDELGQRLTALAHAGGTVEDVIGAEVVAELRAQRLIGPLLSDDAREAAQAVIDLMCALWPDSTAAPDEWWTTPLGRVVARSIDTGPEDTVTRAVAAVMLGVTPGTVAQLTARGTLARHPSGSILRASVLDRIARRRADSETRGATLTNPRHKDTA